MRIDLRKQAFAPPISVWRCRVFSSFLCESSCHPSISFFFLSTHHFYPQSPNPLTSIETFNSIWHISWYSICWTEKRTTTHRKWCQVAAVRLEGGVHPHHPSPTLWSHPADPCDLPGMSQCRRPLSSSLVPPHSFSASRKWPQWIVSHTYRLVYKLWWHDNFVSEMHC